MKVGVIGAGTMGQGIAKAFAQVDGYEVALCDIKQEWAEGGKDKIAKGYARLVEKGKMEQEKVDAVIAETYKMDGIYYIRVWLNQGELAVGDDIMYVLIGGDIRPHVVDALQYLVGRIKNECVTEKEQH